MTEPRDRLSPSFFFKKPPKPGQAKRETSRQQPASPAPASPPGAAPAHGFGQWVGAPRATLAIVFTDLVSSSALGHRLGNRAMDAVRRAHFQRAGQLVDAHAGCLIKTMGDSVMAAFRAAVDALDFAVAIQRDPGDRRLRLRAGIHVGPVSVERQDAHGRTVDYTARIVAENRGAEIWLSSEAKEHVDQEGPADRGGLRWQAHGDLQLKGFPGRHVLWSLVAE